MIVEIVSSVFMGSVALYAKLKQSGVGNDSDKLNKIFKLTGLNVKDGKKTYTTQLLKKLNHSWGVEYRYRIPLGRSFDDYIAKFNHIQDGLNNRKLTIAISFADLTSVDFKKQLIPQIKKLLLKKRSQRKEIELSYNGLLKIKVYNEAMPERIEYTSLNFAGAGWNVPVGVIRENNRLILHDFEKIPHVALGGATRYGKSTFLNMLIVTLLLFQPDNVRFTLIDLKGGIEFGDYENVKQVVNYAEHPEEAEVALKSAVEEMWNKRAQLKANGFKNVQEAGDPIRHFIIIDEVGELNPTEAVSTDEKKLKERCQTYIGQIARLGAGLGFRQVLATQYPTGDVIPRQAKQNSDAKLCFRVQNGTASRVVLDSDGAENLPEIRGRAIYQTADKRQIVQTPFIDTSTIRSVIKPDIVIKTGGEKVNAIEDKQTRAARTDSAKPAEIRFLD